MSLYRRLFSPKQIEIALWIAAAAISFSIYYGDLAARERKTKAIIEEYRINKGINPGSSFQLPDDVLAKLPSRASITPVLFGTAFLLIPLLFRLIFNALPIEMLRYRVPALIPPSEVVASPRSESSRLESADKTDWLQTDAVLLYLRSLAKGSRQIAEKIYLRSGVYLLIGVLVAFSGLAFFYYQQASASQLELTARLVASAPNVLAEGGHVRETKPVTSAETKPSKHSRTRWMRRSKQ
jgi:hypothetical protein